MNDNPFTNPHPTELEDKAHVETVRHFAEDMKQFAVSRSAVKHLERDSAKTVLAVIAASQRPPQGNPILTNDGAHWNKSVDLFDSARACHRPIIDGMEYAVVEHFPTTGRNELWNRGRDAEQVLKSFAHDLRQALQTWTEDMTAQVKEFLAEKYPGHDMARVADSFMHKFTTRALSKRHTITHSHQQKRSHGMGI